MATASLITGFTLFVASGTLQDWQARWARAVGLAMIAGCLAWYCAYRTGQHLRAAYTEKSMHRKQLLLRQLRDDLDVSDPQILRMLQALSADTSLRHKKRSQLTPTEWVEVRSLRPKLERFLMATLHNSERILRLACRIANVLFFVLWAVFVLAATRPSLESMCDFVGDVVGLVYFFSDELTLLLQVLAFLFVTYPFDEGDVVVFVEEPAVTWTVDRIDLWQTTFRDSNSNELVYATNWVLLGTQVINITRSGNMAETFAITVDPQSCPRSKLDKLEQRLARVPTVYEGDFAGLPFLDTIVAVSATCLRLTFQVGHAGNFADAYVRHERSRNFVFFLQAELAALKIHLVDNGDEDASADEEEESNASGMSDLEEDEGGGGAFEYGVLLQ